MPTFQPTPYARGGTIGELIRLRGRNAAEAELRDGDIAAQLFANLGQQVSGLISGYAKDRQEAPLRAQQEESARLDLEAKRGAVDQQARLNRQDTAFMALLEQQPNPDPREVMSIYGPQRGMAIAQGLHAFGELQTGAVKDARDTAGRLAIGAKALKPELLATMWPSIRAAAVKGGLGSERDIPEQPTPEYLDAVIGWATGQQHEQPALIQRDPTKDMVDPRTGQVVMPGTPEAPKPQAPVELNEGALLVDPVTGKVIARGNPKREPAGSRQPIWVQTEDGKFIDLAGVAPPGAKPASSREQGRPVTSGDAGRVADFDTSLDDVSVLRDAISGNKATGTAAYVGTKVPNLLTEFTGWGTDAKSKNAVIARVKQVIGKTLEGGVLRKEDEEKYKDILPTIGDVEDVVMTKLAGLETAIALRRQRFLESLSSANFDTSNFPAEYKAKGPQAPDPTQQTPNLSGLRDGFEREITAGPFKGQVWTKLNGEAVRVR